MSESDAISASGHALCFRVARGVARPLAIGRAGGATRFRVEARHLGGHQKEAIVTEGAEGSRWRLVSDEGPLLKGLDRAPFPLGYFAAGLAIDLAGRLAALGEGGGPLEVRNHYWLSGGFASGDAAGHADPCDVVAPGSAAAQAAVQASPAFAALRDVVPGSFALSVNGRRSAMLDDPGDKEPDRPDPLRTHAAAPTPDPADSLPRDPVRRTDRLEPAGEMPPPDARGRSMRTVIGRAAVDRQGVAAAQTWLALPGCRRFEIDGDNRADAEIAPTGLALLSAGVAFCFITQLLRGLAARRLDIGGIRLTQDWSFAAGPAGADVPGSAGPIHTHLFLSGRAPMSEHRALVSVARRSCFLHAALSGAAPARIVDAAPAIP